MRITKIAQDAIQKYNAGYAAGGEPYYPQWADDILAAGAKNIGADDCDFTEAEIIAERLQNEKDCRFLCRVLITLSVLFGAGGVCCLAAIMGVF